MSTQALEQRQMLAGDFNEAHNYWNDFDVNQDLQLSPSDALSVINFLAAEGSIAAGEAGSEDMFDNRKVDVNNDGNVSPSDALSVINAIARGEGVGEIVALRLTARDENDNILVQNNGITQVGEGIENSFFLEVAYDDLRGFDADGVFTIFPDITTSRGGLLQPVLRESQQVIFGSEIRSTSSGSFSIALEGSSQPAVEVTRAQFLASQTGSVANALVQLGYDADDFQVTDPSFLQENDQIGLQIRYLADDLGNADVPDLIVTTDFDVAVPVTFNEISPLLEDGVTPNIDALPLSLDVRSRSANQEELYNSLNRGTFDSATGFTDVGGVGPIDGLDIPGGFTNVDAFAIEVFVTGPIGDNAPLVIDVNPGSGVDPLTVFGSDDPVPNEMILINENSLVRISTGAATANSDPTVDGPIVDDMRNEDEADFTIDLLTGAEDIDGDALNVTNFSITSGDDAGVTLNGNSLDVTPSAYNALAVGDSETVIATYTIIDGNGGSVGQTLTLTIEGRNDAPEAGDNLSFTNDEFDAAFNIDLLQNATDPDTGDTLDVTAITQVGTDDNSGVVADVANNQIVVTPTAYAALNDGESVTVTYDFTVSDGNGGEDTAQV
ncbi:MAG: cadherin-like domain-containing protein, partial [Planctomycetota bacterium]